MPKADAVSSHQWCQQWRIFQPFSTCVTFHQSSTINPGVIHQSEFSVFIPPGIARVPSEPRRKWDQTPLWRDCCWYKVPLQVGFLRDRRQDTERPSKDLRNLLLQLATIATNSNYFMISKEIHIASSWWLPQIYRCNLKNVRSWALEPLTHLGGACGFPSNKLLHRSINHRWFTWHRFLMHRSGTGGYFGAFGSLVQEPSQHPRSAGPAQTLRLLRHLGGLASVPALLPAALGALAKQRATQEAMTLVDDAVGRRVRRGGRPYRVIPPCCAMIRDPRVKYSL